MSAGLAPHARRAAAFPAPSLRTQFPALMQASGFSFMDNAAGAQVPQVVLDAVNRHLIEHNVQRGGRYPQSVAVDDMIRRARAEVGTFVNARRPEEIAFGMNATSFIRLISLAIGQTLGQRNEIVVTDLDHEANIATWQALQKMGATFRWWHMREDGCLHTEDLQRLLGPRTRLVACTLASNSMGSLLAVRATADLVHAAGGELFLDAVHCAPHAPIDVQEFECDFLVCSGYKIFAPHMGFLWGRYQALAKLPTFREDFIPDEPPGKIEAGTFVYENVAGMAAAIEYLAQVGRLLAGRSEAGSGKPEREDVRTAMEGIRSYEQSLSLELLRVLRDCDAVIYGVNDESRVAQRVPTVLFNLPGVAPAAVTEAAARAGIGIRDGHMYSPHLMKRLGLALDRGAVRVSLVHYNTSSELARLAELLRSLR
jgi:cysteine desulfurase family protein (TIGR01976 family)